MKHLDNSVGPIQRPMRRSMNTLRQTNRFRCDIYTREYFEDFRRKFDALSAATGMNRDEYAAWLVKYKLTDNFTVRLRYLVEFDKHEREAA